MKYSKILLVMTVLVCLAFQACAVSESANNTSSINISSINTSSNIVMVSSGSNIAMVSSGSNKTKVSGGSNNTMGPSRDNLNPNIISSGYYPNFPWYSSDVSFYNQGYNETTFSFYSEYYAIRYACSGHNQYSC
jgi:hypothetical protein